MTLEPRGSFGRQPVLGLTDGYWPPHAYEAPVMGLPAAGQHVWGAFRSGSTRRLVIRHFQNELASRALLYEGQEGSDLGFRPDGESAYHGLCELMEDDAGRWGIVQPSGRFAFTTSAEEGRWVERGIVDVLLRPHLAAMQFVVPDADEPLGYLCRMFLVDGGEVAGEPVDAGVVCHEQVYLRSGRGWALSDYKRSRQVTWIAFVTRFTDGTVHFGQLCWSHGSWRFAAVQRSDADPVLATNVELELEVDADGYPTSQRFYLGGGQTWVWSPPEAGGGRIPLPGPRDHVPRWSEGIVREEGDDREVAFAHTWSEIYPSRLRA